MACLFGHKWSGCRCDKCGKIRDDGHSFTEKSRCTAACSVCGAERVRHHIENGMCTVCDHRPVSEAQYLMARKELDHAVEMKSHNKGEALKHVNQAIKLYPDFASAYHTRGEINFSFTDVSRGVTDIKKAIKLFESQGRSDNAESIRDEYKDRFFYKKLV